MRAVLAIYLVFLAYASANIVKVYNEVRKFITILRTRGSCRCGIVHDPTI